jgi:hemerythrin
MVNELHDAMRKGVGRDKVGETIKGLVEYTASHFATEEHYCDQYHYPHGFMHKKQHADFAARAVQFKQKFDAGEAVLSVEVIEFLSDWLKTHIMDSDHKLGAHLVAKGAS